MPKVLETPTLEGKIAAAMVRGIQSRHIAATVKHFACNNKETNRKSQVHGLLDPLRVAVGHFQVVSGQDFLIVLSLGPPRVRLRRRPTSR